MLRIRKRNITAAVISASLLVVADPFLQSGLVGSTAPVERAEKIEGQIYGETAAMLTKPQVVINGVFENRNDSAANIYQVPFVSPTETVEEDSSEENGNENASDTENSEVIDSENGITDSGNGHIGSEDNIPDSDDDSATEETEEAEQAEPTLEEKKAAILQALTEKGSYTFDWYGQAITLTYKDYIYLCKLIQRETIGEDVEGRIMVTNLIFNRVCHRSFANDVVSVINQPNQFSPVKNGTVNSARPDEVTIDAVLSAMAGIDYSQGALYFKMTDYYSKWFNTAAIQVLFSHGCHTFYR